MVVNDTPFSNPGAAPALVEMWRNNLRKSQQRIPAPPTLPSVIVINFDGAGQPLVAGQAGMVEVTFPCRILSCHLYAGVYTPPTTTPIVVPAALAPSVATASVDLRIGSQGYWLAGAQPIYGTAMPGLALEAEASIDVSTWTVLDLQPGDILPYFLAAFTGTATFLTLTLPVRRLDVTGIGVQPVTDAAGDAFTTAAGSEFVIRG